MVNWQITAKTIYCEPVDEEVTIIIKKDWSVQCTGCRNRNNELVPGKKSVSGCEGLDCSRVSRYLSQLKAEEGLSQ